MDKYKRYQGVIIFSTAVVIILALLIGRFIVPKVNELNSLQNEVQAKQNELNELRSKLQVVQNKIKKIKESISTSQKKIYSPVESDLGNETLFFTLYNDVVEMLHANSIKIKSISYVYNPEADNFVKFGKDIYFVCDVNMELVSNYVNLGKLIQDLYQYPYYIRINNIEVKPYDKDKRILLSTLSLRLYAHTAPDDTADSTAADYSAAPLAGADTALPQ